MTPSLGTISATLPVPPLNTQPLTELEIIFEGGPFDGDIRTISRDARSVVMGLHRHPHLDLFDIYSRTINVCPSTFRTVFAYSGRELHEAPRYSLFERVMLLLRLQQPTRITFGE